VFYLYQAVQIYPIIAIKLSFSSSDLGPMNINLNHQYSDITHAKDKEWFFLFGSRHFPCFLVQKLQRNNVYRLSFIAMALPRIDLISTITHSKKWTCTPLSSPSQQPHYLLVLSTRQNLYWQICQESHLYTIKSHTL
jgi:hypothetical protein